MSPARTAAAFAADRPGAVAASFSAALLLAALGFEHLGGMRPCELCMAQRWCHVAAIALGTASLAFRGRVSASLAFASCIALIAGAGVAGYHVGVEEGFWAASCSTDARMARTADELMASLSALPAPRCDEVAWKSLGLSMAAWNGLASFAVGLPAALASLRTGR